MTHRNMRLSLLALSLVASPLAGCADAGSDAPDGGAPGAQRTVYRVSEVILPASAGDAAELGLDLDADGTIDNRLGLVHGLLAERWGMTLSGGASEALRAQLPWLLVVDEHEGGNAVDAWLATGSSGDPLAPLLSGAVGATGRWIGDHAALAGGSGPVPVGALGDPAPIRADDAEPGWCETSFATTLERSQDGMTATLGVALAVDDVRAAIAAPLAAFLTEAAGGDALSAQFARVADGNADGVVTPAEVLAHPLLTGLLAADLDLDGDGVDESISLGLWLEATPVE